MKTDRELLELAAKAYFAQEVADGVCSFWWDEKEQAIVYIHGANQDHNGNDVELLWIPRDDDGDALRLAVNLKFTISRNDCECCVVVFGDQDHEDLEVSERFKEVDGPEIQDPYAATRRAIVRAAAAIGEAM